MDIHQYLRFQLTAISCTSFEIEFNIMQVINNIADNIKLYFQCNQISILIHETRYKTNFLR